MLAAASRARNLLGDSAELVVKFIGKQNNEDGGFKGRGEASDLYYTLFGIEALMALNTEVPWGRVAGYLQQFGDGASLDLVHLACLARCWADIAESQNAGIEASVREGLLRNIESYKCSDGGYSNSGRGGDSAGRLAAGTAYGCFLALGACQDLNARMEDVAALGNCVRSLRTADGAYSNDSTIQIGSTAATAAAVTVLHYLGGPVDSVAADWLLSRLHEEGGFVAIPNSGRYAILHRTPFGADLLSTATALHALSLMGVSTSAVKEKCLDFLDGLWSAEGGFAPSWADEVLDCEYTYYGLLSLGHLNTEFST